jgi:integrase
MPFTANLIYRRIKIMGVFKKNNRWWIDYYVNGRRVRKAISKSKTEAEKVLTKIQSEILHKRYAIPEDKKITFTDFAEKIVENQTKLTKRGRQTYISLLKNLVVYFGDYYIDEINDYHCEQYKRKRIKQKCQKGDKTLSPAYINRDLSLLRSVLNKAVRWGYLSTNPVKKIEFFKEEPKERILTIDEMKKLIDTAKNPLKNIILVALNTGMRQNEIYNLEWHQVNIDERFITVQKTKTKKLRRIPLNKTMVELFSRLYSENGTNRFVFTNPKRGTHYVFNHGVWKKLLIKAGIENLRFHDLRHCFATYALLKGGDLISLKETLGHSDITTTARYTKALLEGQRKLVYGFEISGE